MVGYGLTTWTVLHSVYITNYKAPKKADSYHSYMLHVLINSKDATITYLANLLNLSLNYHFPFFQNSKALKEEKCKVVKPIATVTLNLFGYHVMWVKHYAVLSKLGPCEWKRDNFSHYWVSVLSHFLHRSKKPFLSKITIIHYSTKNSYRIENMKQKEYILLCIKSYKEWI